MTTTAQHRAIVDALGLTADDLRDLASAIDAEAPTILVRQIAEAAIAALPSNHRYVPSLRRLVAYAGDRNAAQIPTGDVDIWARQAGEAARHRANSRHGLGAHEAFVLAVRSAYALAIAAGQLQHNPAADAEIPTRPASNRTALTAEQLRQSHLGLLAHSRDAELDDLVFQFLRETACRRAGVIGLETGQLAPANLAARVIEKYGKDRWVIVSAHLMDRLVGHHDARGCGCARVLHRSDGGHLNDKWFEGFGRRIQRLAWAGELGVTAHWLRHTTLTDIERLAGVRIAAAYAGHSDTSFGVTGRYTKVSLDEKRIAHQSLFFDDPIQAGDPAVPPLLFRRVLPATTRPFEFAA